MARVAKEKGIHLLTASDFTHPVWFEDIKSQLVESNDGVYTLKEKQEIQDNQIEPRFILSTEISCIYTQSGKLRRIHNLIFAPNIETVEKIITEMKKRGYNLHSDGRPIIGLSAHDLLEMILRIDDRCMLIPCHVWTPHFGLYGSASGFDSIEEAFGDLAAYIYGVETGLSSDPEMNWQISELRTRSILSFSDAHSPQKMGREATVFVRQNQESGTIIEDITYEEIRKAIKKDKDALLKVGYTVEFYPEEGKYHYSGHRNCKYSKSPDDVTSTGNGCGVCGKKMTEGVFVRLKQLSGKEIFDKPIKEVRDNGIAWYTDPKGHHPPFIKLVPLLEIVAESLSSTVQSQKSKKLYSLLLSTFGSEFDVLLRTPVTDIATKVNDRVAQGIAKVRRGDIDIHPGYDGEYGKVQIWQKGDMVSDSAQLSLTL